MRLHYKGKYNLDPASLPGAEQHPHAVMFREASDSAALGRIANTVALLVLLPGLALLFLRCGRPVFSAIGPGGLLSCLILFPHEILHALCFREDVYLYTNWKQGILFVVGPEHMSRARFVFMSLLPNLVFGALPFTVAMIFPQYPILGCFGLFSICAGGGDYYNIWNAMTQMPKGAKTYLHRFHSWWYLPESEHPQEQEVLR